MLCSQYQTTIKVPNIVSDLNILKRVQLQKSLNRFPDSNVNYLRLVFNLILDKRKSVKMSPTNTYAGQNIIIIMLYVANF